MANPYASKGPQHIWRTAVADPPTAAVEPIPAKRIALADTSIIATFGSCFAQHIAREIKAKGRGRFLQQEMATGEQPVFSALYGNVYTVRQFAQLFDEAFGHRQTAVLAWQREDGRYVDCLRPFMFPEGFASPDAVKAARQQHLAAVRKVFTDCTVLVFTLGLTEYWQSTVDGTVFPIAPGVVNPNIPESEYAFGNFNYPEAYADLDHFIDAFKAVNPAAQILLTVSPVPLTATYTNDHVLVATAHSKAILRAVCGAAEASHDHVFYFPSYEIISGHYNHGAYYDPNLRTVKPEGVAHVMRVFEHAYWPAAAPAAAPPPPAPVRTQPQSAEAQTVFCDEEEIEKSVGF